MILIISLIINLILIGIIFIQLNTKPKKTTSISKENEIIKEILDLGLVRDFNKSNVIIEILRKYYKIDYCSLLLDKEGLHCIATNVEKDYVNDIVAKCSTMSRQLDGAAKISISESYFDYESSKKRKIKYLYFIPLKNNNETIGSIFIENKEDYKETRFELDFFKLVIKNITLALQSCVYADEIMQLAMRDNLTGIFNRNYMDRYITNLSKSNKSIIISIMDIDHFKSVNDTYGHDFGDKVLITVSAAIKEMLEDNEELYRWGGEEFILSFYDKNLKEVEQKVNLIREKIYQTIIESNDIKISVTASFGVSQFDQTLFKTISKADKGLYMSKHNGRNKATVY